MALQLFVFFFSFYVFFAVGDTYTDSERGFQFHYNSDSWQVAPPLKSAPNTKEVDAPLAKKTVITIERKQVDNGYHPRFSIVVDGIEKKQAGTDLLADYGAKKAVRFLEDQKFVLHVSGLRKKTERTELPQWDGNVYEILASHQHYDLTVRQVILLQGEQFFLLSAAAKIKSYPGLKPELDRIFDSFSFKKSHP